MRPLNIKVSVTARLLDSRRAGGRSPATDTSNLGVGVLTVWLGWPAMANGRVEQLVARRAHNPEVAGSSPASAI